MDKININQRKRVESGAVQFVDETGQLDWAGLYLRGDDAFALANEIQAIKEGIESLLDEKTKKTLWYQVYFKNLLALKDTILNEVIVSSKLLEK
jgi:hypothetical protein